MQSVREECLNFCQWHIWLDPGLRSSHFTCCPNGSSETWMWFFFKRTAAQKGFVRLPKFGGKSHTKSYRRDVLSGVLAGCACYEGFHILSELSSPFFSNFVHSMLRQQTLPDSSMAGVVYFTVLAAFLFLVECNHGHLELPSPEDSLYWNVHSTLEPLLAMISEASTRSDCPGSWKDCRLLALYFYRRCRVKLVALLGCVPMVIWLPWRLEIGEVFSFLEGRTTLFCKRVRPWWQGYLIFWTLPAISARFVAAFLFAIENVSVVVPNSDATYSQARQPEGWSAARWFHFEYWRC